MEKTVLTKLRAVMEEKELDVARLGRKLGGRCSSSIIYKSLRGEEISKLKAIEIAKSLKVKLEDLT